MRVVFMGTPAFAVPSLRALAAAHDVVLVVTRPDSAGGRGAGLRASAVKEAAVELGIPVMQPLTLAGEATGTIASCAPDVICVAAFGMLLPPETLAVPVHGCINVHASLLPRYRGAAPIQRAILNGDAETGVSIMRMEAGLDTGPYALQRRVPIGERTSPELEDDLARIGAAALLDVLQQIEAASVAWTPQDESAATYAAKITKDDVALFPTLSVTDALRRVRAQTRSAPSRACLGDQDLTIVRARPAVATVAPGAVCLVGDDPVLGFSDGAIALDVVRPAGRGEMQGCDWARGARLAADACWRCTR